MLIPSGKINFMEIIQHDIESDSSEKEEFLITQLTDTLNVPYRNNQKMPHVFRTDIESCGKQIITIEDIVTILLDHFTEYTIAHRLIHTD